jgi:thiamine-phosphate pyrophosphorylase
VLAEAFLYGIVDLAYVADADAPEMLQQLLNGEVDIIQLRGKGRSVSELITVANKLLPRTTAANVPLIINDHAEIARSVLLQGVHVGQEDESIATVRSRVNRAIIVGKSTHSIEQAVAAEKEGADYIGFGPIFATPTKPDYRPIGLEDICEVHRRVSIPIFCIGGIKLENLPEVIAAGAKRVAIVSGLLRGANPAEYARRVKTLLRTANVIPSEVEESR